MDDAQSEYRRRLQARIAELEQAMQSLTSAFSDSAGEVRRIAHQLHGSGGTYGFPEVSEAAAAAERARNTDFASATGSLLQVLRDVSAGKASAGIPLSVPVTPPGSGPVILVVDDDPDITRLLGTILAAPDRRIAVAETARDARAFLATTDVALLILDLFLPDEDGRHLLAELRHRPATAALPVFVLSAHVGGPIKTECYDLGADGYFEKPMDPAVLAAAVTSRLARQPDQSSGSPRGANGAAAAGTVASRRTATPVVLLAEDDELIALVIRHRLSREGFDVRHYPDGAAALAGAKGLRADLAILDVMMPAMDGFELLARLRELPAWADVPVLMLTSLGDEKDLVRAFDLGASDYVVKPFSPAELVARVSRLVTA